MNESKIKYLKVLKKYNKYPLVEVRWLDHSGDAGWIELQSLDEPPIEAKTIGWLVKEDDYRYHVMNTLTDDGGQGGNSEILKSCVTEFKIIRKLY